MLTLNHPKQKRGFTLIEIAIVVGIIGIAAALALTNLTATIRSADARGTARDLADLLAMARADAIQTGVNQIVIFDSGALPGGMTGGDTGGLVHPSSNEDFNLMALRFQDNDDNGELTGVGELRGFVRFDPNISFGATAVTEEAPHDPLHLASYQAVGVSFVDTDNSDWYGTLFMPDGIPRPFKPGPPFVIGVIGKGGGAVYIQMTQPPRNYAIQLSPGGAVSVSKWESAEGDWK